MIPVQTFPILTINQPSNKKDLRFRPYLVKEEKLILLTKQANQKNPEVKDIFNCIKQIVKACCQERDLDVDKIPLFDLEYIFLKLRSLSVNNIENITVTDYEDKLEYPLLVKFDDIKIKFPENPIDKNIKLGNDMMIVMKYPSASIYQDDNKSLIEKLANNDLFSFIVECIDKIFVRDNILTFTSEELKEFIDNLDIKTYNKMKQFIVELPKIEYKLEYINSLKNNRFVSFNSITDFFFFL